MRNNRNGITLVETIVLLGIISLIMALIIPAIQRARSSVDRMSCQNQLRQIMLAFHNYAASNQNRLPGIEYPGGPVKFCESPLFAILPYIETDAKYPYYTEWPDGDNGFPVVYPLVKLFLSPLDPSLQQVRSGNLGFDYYLRFGPTSYAVNMLVHSGKPRLGSHTISDGLTYTMGISERYYITGNRRGISTYPQSDAGGSSRRATFCDANEGDVLPITFGSPPRTLPSRPNVTFQIAPQVKDADDRLLQSSQTAGLITAMYDGSIRIFVPGTSVEVFWGSITPRGGEAVNLD